MEFRFSLVCLVAVPHFDSPFNEADHVFILHKMAEDTIEETGGGVIKMKVNFNKT